MEKGAGDGEEDYAEGGSVGEDECDDREGVGGGEEGKDIEDEEGVLAADLMTAGEDFDVDRVIGDAIPITIPIIFGKGEP